MGVCLCVCVYVCVHVCVHVYVFLHAYVCDGHLFTYMQISFVLG